MLDVSIKSSSSNLSSITELQDQEHWPTVTKSNLSLFLFIVIAMVLLKFRR